MSAPGQDLQDEEAFAYPISSRTRRQQDASSPRTGRQLQVDTSAGHGDKISSWALNSGVGQMRNTRQHSQLLAFATTRPGSSSALAGMTEFETITAMGIRNEKPAKEQSKKPSERPRRTKVEKKPQLLVRLPLAKGFAGAAFLRDPDNEDEEMNVDDEYELPCR